MARILHIEDDSANRLLVRKILTPAGFDVVDAADGVEGIRKAISEHPGAGVTVFLRDPELHGLAERLAGVEKPKAIDRSIRNYGVGAQILLDLGVRDMIVMSSTRPNPTALEGYGLRIVGWRDMDGEEQS